MVLKFGIYKNNIQMHGYNLYTDQTGQVSYGGNVQVDLTLRNPNYDWYETD